MPKQFQHLFNSTTRCMNHKIKKIYIFFLQPFPFLSTSGLYYIWIKIRKEHTVNFCSFISIFLSGTDFHTVQYAF